MKRFLIVLLTLALCMGCCGAFAEEEKVLRIYSWEDYVDADTIAGFSEEYGIDVEFITFASNEEMLLKLEQGGGENYDIIVASDYVISSARKKDLLMPLDKDKLANFGNLNPNYLNQYFDPDNVYSIPYTVGSPMIVYDPDRVEGDIRCFADLWDPQFADSLCLLDDARVMIGETLKMLGYSYNTTDDAQLQEASDKLMELKPNVRALDYDMAYQYLLSGEVSAAYLFTNFAVICQMENPNLVAVYPEEGVGFGVDSLVIPTGAQHPDNAHLFLDYVMRPEVAAHIAEYQLYINPNQAAEAYIDPALKDYAAFNIPEDKIATAEYVQDVGEYEGKFQEIWMNFKLK